MNKGNDTGGIMTDKKSKPSDEVMKRRALARWENDGGPDVPEKPAEAKPVRAPFRESAKKSGGAASASVYSLRRRPG